MPNQNLSSDNTKKKQRGVFWFRHDLRLHDQVALASLCEQVDEISFVYIVDESYFSPTQYGLKQIGDKRYQFLMHRWKRKVINLPFSKAASQNVCQMC